MSRQVAALALASVMAGSVLVSGCVAAAGAAGLQGAQNRTIGQAVDDAAASNQIKLGLVAEGGLGEVDVEVVDGLVLLSGRVATPELRTRAEDIAWTSQYTFDVANEVVIERPGGFFTNLADEVTTTRVRAALLGSSSVRSFNFNIETYDGIVYLMGIVSTPEERVAAAEEASRVGGVRQVVSYVRVRAPAAPQGPAPVQGAGQEPYDPSRPATDDDLLGGNY